MAYFASQEDRPLKRARLGAPGPEVYPQDRKQREDELTALSVKHGFSNQPLLRDEHGSARDNNLNATKMAAVFGAILAKKHEHNTINDLAKKKQTINTKDNFYLAGIPPRGRQMLESWFKDLAGHKPLMMLAKKVPIYNKKEEIFQKLCEENVPLSRAAWLIKMTNAYQTAITDQNKSKKRQAVDPFLEWTQVLTRHMREQLQRILDYHQGTGVQSGFLTTGAAAAPSTSIDVATRQWTYCAQLAQHMYDEGLVDRHEYLVWMVELLEKVKITDNTVLKLLLAQIVQFTSEFVQSNMLARRLAHFCARKVSQLCSDTPCAPGVPSTAVDTAGSSPSVPQSISGISLQPSSTSLFADYCNCLQHRSLLLTLSAIIQAVALACPSALVWHNLGESKSSSPLSGSPLDLLPCAPSSLPMPASGDNARLRAELRVREEEIVARSRAAELKWSADKRQQSTTGAVVNGVLGALETLDRHNFERAESSSPLDALYQKLFGAGVTAREQSGEGGEAPGVDESLVNLLCEWAVSTSRTGEHRAIVVARLLERYQGELVAADKAGEGEGVNDDRESIASEFVGGGVPPLQGLLMRFLDTKAPVLEDASGADKRQSFANLILLFCQLIHHDVFSHDAYICTLISRGDLQSASYSSSSRAAPLHPYQADLSSIKSDGIKPEIHEDMKIELECQNLDSEFGVFAFKEDCKQSPDRQGSMHLEHSVLSGGSGTPGGALTPSGSYISGMARTPGAAGGPLTPRSSRTPGPHTPGTAHTPGGGMTPGSMTPGATPGIYHSMVQTPGMAHTPASIPGPSLLPHESRSLTQLYKGPSRHFTFATHFPIPLSESSMSHESNQRMVVLYGVGKQRDEARHAVKKITKEIGKLFSKKNSIDVTIGDVSKAKKKKEKAIDVDPASSLENTFAKFRKLSYYDKHAVTDVVSRSLAETMSTFAAGSSTCVPVIDSVSYLFDLMEYCLSIGRLLDLSTQLLKDLPEVEAQLSAKSSCLAGTYTTRLCLCIVGVLRKYHACLLVSPDQTAAAFESLCKVVKHVDKPSDCTSAERSILAYLYDLYTSCGYIKARYIDLFGGPCAKVKSTLYTEVTPSSSNHSYEEQFAKDLMENPRGKVDPQFLRQLSECAANRYSFVCSALINLCNCPSVDRLNDIAVLCAELTACCNALSSEWLGVLKALCWSSNHNCGFIDVLTQVDVGDFSIHDSLAVFTAVLIARHCFTLEELVGSVALQSLLAACPSVGSGGDPDAELGARLTCHLLLRLFQMMNTVPGHAPDTRKGGAMCVKSSCDRHLLEAAHKRINVGAVIAVLKAILMLGDGCGAADSKDFSSPSKKEANVDIISSMLSSLDGEGDLGLGGLIGGSQSKGRIESAGLSEYGKHCLRQICAQEWVRDKFLKEPEQLFSADLLLDKMLSHAQAQQLVQMICYTGGGPPPAAGRGKPGVGDTEGDDEDEPEQRRHITRILQGVDQWTQRTSWLELQLMIKQASPAEMSPLLDNIAKSTIDVFRKPSERRLGGGGGSSAVQRALDSSSGGGGGEGGGDSSVWLIAPLISRLTSAVQGRVLRTAAQVLETGNQFWSTKNARERERHLVRSTTLLGNAPFLALVLACLRGQDEQRDGLLKSLHDQLDKFVVHAREQQDRVPLHTDDHLQALLQQALALRLSLVGNMFETIQRSNALTHDWALLLLQLVVHGVVDAHACAADLCTTVLDMLDVLVHGTLASDNPERAEESKKVHQTLMRKLKKELGERRSPSIDLVRRLLPLPKVYSEVVACDAHGGDTRAGGGGGHKGGDVDRRQGGLQVSRRERISPWEILEGHKNPAPLSLAWFGAVRLERRPLRCEEQHRQLLHHSHATKRPASFYLEPPPLPPESHHDPQSDKADLKVLEPMLEQKQMPEIRASKSKSKRAPSNSGQRRPAQGRPAPAGGAPYMQPQTPAVANFTRTPDMYAPQGTAQGAAAAPGGWFQGGNYPQAAVGGPRGYAGGQMMQNSRQQLLLRARQPPASAYMAGAQAWPVGAIRNPRAALQRGAGARPMLEGGMYPQQAMMGFPGGQAMVNQGYGGGYAQQGLPAGSGAIMDQGGPGGGGGAQAFTPPFQGGGGSGLAMGLQGKPSVYMGGATHQTQFAASQQSRYSSMVGMGGGQGGSGMLVPTLPRYGQLSQSGSIRQGMTPGGGSAAYMQQHEQQQRVAAARQQQQQLALQQQMQQQQMQQQQQQQPSAVSMMSLQRQMSGSGQQQGQQFNHPYPQYQN